MKMRDVRILAAVTLLLTGCVPKSPEKAEWVKAASAVHLRYWDMPHWRGFFGGPLDQQQPYDAWPRYKIREFELLHPGVQIDFLLIPWRDEKIKLELAMASGRPPDVVYRNAVDLPRLVAQEVLAPIDSFLSPQDRADIPAWVWERVTFDHKTYAWPWYASTTALAVNLDLFREAGALSLLPLSGQRAWTVQEFLRACLAVTRDRDGDGTTDVYALALFGVDDHFLYDGFLAGNGVVGWLTPDERRCQLDSPAAAEVLQFLADLVLRHRVAVPGAAGLRYADAYSLFLQQKAAMFPGGMWLIQAIEAQAPQRFAYTFVPFPHWPGHRSRSRAILATYAVFRSEDSLRTRAAMELARFLTNTRNAIAVTGNSTFPVRRSCGDPYYGDERFAVFRAYLNDPIPEFKRPHSLEIEAALRPLYQAVLAGEQAPEAALSAYARKINEILAEEQASAGR